MRNKIPFLLLNVQDAIVWESKEGDIATGAGHHSVVKRRDNGEYVMVNHRRPLRNEDRDHRVTCLDAMEFNVDGTIKPIKMTFEGVAPDTSNNQE